MRARKKPTKRSGNSSAVEQTLERGERKEIRNLFAFDSTHSDDEVLFKFNLWSRWFFPQFFMNETKTEVIADAPFHETMDRESIRTYRYDLQVFVDAGFRGAAKTTRKKLWRGYVIANDRDHRRRYFKILTKDIANARQTVTDIYNMFVNPKVRYYYPEIFEKTVEKRTETMSEFDTSSGIKVRAGTVGQEQRGALQDETRPDDLWFDDFETRKVLRSAVQIQAIWDNMEEARDGLSRTGGATYTCNYLSERGNVHKLIKKYTKHSLLTPIKGKIKLNVSGDSVDATHIDGPPTWPAAYTPKQVEKKISESEDAAGEFLCSPAAGEDAFFPRKMIDKQERKEPIEEVAGFKIFHKYDPSHRYGSGHDVGAGVGLDHSTSCFIDFTQFPAQVVGTYVSNTIKPDVFGDEIKREARNFGRPIVAVENNKFDMCIGRLKQIYSNIYTMKERPTRAGKPSKIRQWGWNTNALTKPEMFSALRKAVKDGHLELSDPALIAEARAYTRDDFMDTEEDPRLSTRHFDLLTAAAIAWQMRNFAEQPQQSYEQSSYQPSSEYENAPEAPTATPRKGPNPNHYEPDYEQPPYEGMTEYE